MYTIVDNGGNRDPWFNLALEEHVLRTSPDNLTLLFIYVNNPSVIIGRNQNPWQEVNLSFAEQENIPVIRRISGGGTVFHDTGNVNFSFIQKFSDKSFNKYSEFTAPVIKYLNTISIPAALNERNDIVAVDKKISGNAQFTSRNMMLSHGTLLVNSDLNTLGDSLKIKHLFFESKSTKSTRSTVTSLSEYSGKYITVEEVIEGVKEIIKYQGGLEIRPLTDEDIKAVNKLTDEKYKSFEWTYGRTHDFTVENNGKDKLKVYVEKGFIVKTEAGGNGDVIEIPQGKVKFLPGFIKDSDLDRKIKDQLINYFF